MVFDFSLYRVRFSYRIFLKNKMGQMRRKKITFFLFATQVLCISFLLLGDKSFANNQEGVQLLQTEEGMYKSARKSYYALKNSNSAKSRPDKWRQVITKFQKVVDSFPKSYEAHKAAFTIAQLYRGMFRRFKGSDDLKRALFYFQMVAAKENDNSFGDDALYAIGEIYFKRKLFEDARKAYLQALQSFPGGDKTAKIKKRLNDISVLLKPSEGNNGENSKLMKVATLKGLKILGQAPNLKILVKIDGQVAFKSNQLTKPNRHYIDLSNSVLGRGFSKLIPVNSKGLKEVRVSQFDKRVSRVVFELVDNARPGFKTRVTSAGLEVELIYSQFTKQSKRTASKKNSETGLGMKLTDKIKRIPMIVLDPGHGGKDDGAHGGSGLLEKHLNLEISKRVKKILEVRYGFKVALTRSDDTFIPLEKRGDIANDLDAELFVSIHVNAAMRKGAKGIETYFLGRGLSERARQTAARENGEVIFSVPNNDVQRILMDMEANRKMNNSSCLARRVQDRLANGMAKYYGGIKNLGVKEGPFYVLHTTYMPSILVEVGFITNRQEEKRLRSSRYLERLASNIARGIKAAMPVDKKCAQTI